jgi:hypothetical protein
MREKKGKEQGDSGEDFLLSPGGQQKSGGFPLFPFGEY